MFFAINFVMLGWKERGKRMINYLMDRIQENILNTKAKGLIVIGDCKRGRYWFYFRSICFDSFGDKGN